MKAYRHTACWLTYPIYITTGCNIHWENSHLFVSEMPCLCPTRWSLAQMPVQETRLGLPWDSCGFLGQSRVPHVPGGGGEGGREGGKACLIAEQSRHGWSETNKVLNRCLVGSPGEKAGTGAGLRGQHQWLFTGRMDRSSTLVCASSFYSMDVPWAARCWQHGLGWVLACWLVCCPALSWLESK